MISYALDESNVSSERVNGFKAHLPLRSKGLTEQVRGKMITFMFLLTWVLT